MSTVITVSFTGPAWQRIAAPDDPTETRDIVVCDTCRDIEQQAGADLWPVEPGDLWRGAVCDACGRQLPRTILDTITPGHLVEITPGDHALSPYTGEALKLPVRLRISNVGPTDHHGMIRLTGLPSRADGHPQWKAKPRSVDVHAEAIAAVYRHPDDLDVDMWRARRTAAASVEAEADAAHHTLAMLLGETAAHRNLTEVITRMTRAVTGYELEIRTDPATVHTHYATDHAARRVTVRLNSRQATSHHRWVTVAAAASISSDYRWILQDALREVATTTTFEPLV